MNLLNHSKQPVKDKRSPKYCLPQLPPVACPVRVPTLALVIYLYLIATLHTKHCTLHNAHWTLHTTRCTLNTAHCTLRNAHCTLHAAHCTLYTAHCTLKMKSEYCILHTKLCPEGKQQWSDWSSWSHKWSCIHIILAFFTITITILQFGVARVVYSLIAILLTMLLDRRSQRESRF